MVENIFFKKIKKIVAMSILSDYLKSNSININFMRGRYMDDGPEQFLQKISRIIF